MRDNNGFFSIESYAQDEVQQRTVNVSELRYSNAVVTNDGQTFIFTVKDASNIMCLYPSLKDGTAIMFSNFTGNVGTSKNGTLFARNSGFATATIDGEKYTILFDFGNGSTDNGQSNSGDEPSNVVEQRDVNVSELRYSNAVVTNDGQTFIFTVKDASNIMCLYPSLKDGTAITFSNFTGNVGTSKNGTLFARNSGFATATIDGEEYTIQFDFGKKDRDIERLLRYSGAELCVRGRVITLNVKTGSDYISVFPSLTDGTEITFSNLTGDTGISRNGTLYSRSNATAIATIDGTAYIIVFYSFPEESLGNNTDDIDAFPGHKYFVGHKNNQKTISIKEEVPTIGRYYINNKGDLIASSSNYIKKLDLSKYIPTTIKCQSRSSSWYSYAFYSSTDTFDSTTFISGGKVKTSKTDTTFDIVGIPKNALTMLAVRYSSTTWEAIGYEATGDYPYCDVKDAMDQWKNDGYPDARIYKQEQVPKVIYHVGNGQEYSDLISAVKRWIADEKPCATIYVDKGEYITQNDPAGSNNPLLIRGSANRLTIIGEDKESTIVRSTTGEYVHPAINIQGGNVTVKNITFVADHTSNPNFSYLDYAKSLNSAYAVHCDGGAKSGVVPGV
ncbi:MAG: hypothetical protein IJU39_04260, partial [Clostridia bacterium]|nr:hypothetical protein [Clostridia bacterium]